MRSFLLLTLAVAGAQAIAADAGANPIRKIVTLLQDMQKEVEAEGEKDKELYEKFMCFCNNGGGELQKAASDAKAQIEELSARLEEEKSEKAQLEQDLIQHNSDREQAGVDLEKATSIRSKEQNDYEVESVDQKTNIDAIGKAIPALEAGLGGGSLVQLGAGVPDVLKKALASSEMISSMQRSDALSFLSGSQSSPSSEIVGIMKTMKEEMAKSLEGIEESESASSKGFAELKSAKDTEVELATEAIETKQKRIGELGVLVVQRANGIEDAEKEQKDAEEFLSTLDEECVSKKAEYATRSKTRMDEVTAISQAISVLNDDDALDIFKKAAFVQEGSKKSERQFGFLQGRAMNQGKRLQKAQQILTTAAQFFKSPQLNLIAMSMRSKLSSMEKAAAQGKEATQGAVDFGEIVKSIDEMMSVLQKEMVDDEKHKEWCRGEFEKVDVDAKKSQTQIASVTAMMEEMSDEVSMLADDMTTLQAGIASMDKTVSDVTEQRKAEHAEYLAAAQLTTAAVELMKKAKNKLQKFYNPDLYKEEPKDAEAALLGVSLIQKASKVAPPQAPDTFSGPAQPNKKSGGVLALMDEMTHDLKMQGQEAEQAEKTSQKDYVDVMAESQKTRETDSKSLVDKSASKATLESKLTDAKESKFNSIKEMENNHQYASELHISCDFIIENFTVRKEARVNELEGLKNAKGVLASASFGF